jgi:hypothetical protein
MLLLLVRPELRGCLLEHVHATAAPAWNNHQRLCFRLESDEEGELFARRWLPD